MALKLISMYFIVLAGILGILIYLVLKYNYRALIEFRPSHHLLLILLVFWDNVILYSAVARALTHYNVLLCIAAGYLVGSVLHRKDLAETYNVWRLNCGKK